MTLTINDVKDLAELTVELGLSDGEARIVAALVESFGSIEDDETLNDSEREAEFEKSATEFVAYIKGGDDAASIANQVLKKVRARRNRGRRAKVKFTVGSPAAAGLTGKEATMKKVTKSFVLGQLNALANLAKRKDETEAQAFVRFMETAEGAEGYRAYKSLPDDEPAAIEAKPASPDAALPAYQAIKKRAGELQRAFPKLSDAAAFAKVYEDPSSAALREALKRERAAIAA